MASRVLLSSIVVILILHGLIHLMGTAVYMRLAEIDGFAFKTTLLRGRVDLGEQGIRIFGALWLLPAVGFVLAALGLVAGWHLWMPVLVASALFSLVLTGVDWNIAFMGTITDVVILALVPVAGTLAR